jgi:hypothetical protein
MILIPEIETIVLLVPRTGSGSLRKALLAKYPKAIQIYRHMEADGVPHGYSRWPKIGVVRNPVERLWSLYKFIATMDGPYEAAFLERMRRSACGVSFSDWILNNREVFTSHYDGTGLCKVFPQYTVLHPMPENQKSQFVYLRPDLGTTIYRYDVDQRDLFERLNVVPTKETNASRVEPVPTITGRAAAYLGRVFDWDFKRSHGTRT